MLLDDFIGTGNAGILPGDPVHQRLITASKISACCVPSRSPYESFDSLYRQLAGLVPKKEIDPDLAERGHRLEPFMADWFADKHPEFEVVDPHVDSPMTWFVSDRFAATPDRLLVQDGEVVGLLEVKTAARSEGWGIDGSADIPVHYYDQRPATPGNHSPTPTASTQPPQPTSQYVQDYGAQCTLGTP